MIKVTLWWGNAYGNGLSSYLVNAGSAIPGKYFEGTREINAIRRVLEEFRVEAPDNRRITRIDIGEAPDKVLAL